MEVRKDILITINQLSKEGLSNMNENESSMSSDLYIQDMKDVWKAAEGYKSDVKFDIDAGLSRVLTTLDSIDIGYQETSLDQSTINTKGNKIVLGLLSMILFGGLFLLNSIGKESLNIINESFKPKTVQVEQSVKVILAPNAKIKTSDPTQNEISISYSHISDEDFQSKVNNSLLSLLNSEQQQKLKNSDLSNVEYQNWKGIVISDALRNSDVQNSNKKILNISDRLENILIEEFVMSSLNNLTDQSIDGLSNRMIPEISAYDIDKGESAWNVNSGQTVLIGLPSNHFALAHNANFNVNITDKGYALDVLTGSVKIFTLKENVSGNKNIFLDVLENVNLSNEYVQKLIGNEEIQVVDIAYTNENNLSTNYLNRTSEGYGVSLFGVDQNVIYAKTKNINELNWSKGLLVFNNTPIEEVFNRIEEFFDVSIHITDQSIDNIRGCNYTASQDMGDDGLSTCLEFLQASIHMNLERRDVREIYISEINCDK